jgi:hypothetical protein
MGLQSHDFSQGLDAPWVSGVGAKTEKMRNPSAKNNGPQTSLTALLDRYWDSQS